MLSEGTTRAEMSSGFEAYDTIFPTLVELSIVC